DALTVAGVLTTDDFVEERSIRGQILEVDRTAHQQRVPDRVLQVTVGTFDPAVLVRNTAVVARRFHAIVAAQSIVAAGEVLAGFMVEIAEGRRQTVAAMLERSAAECPQRVLQPFGECHVTLATQDDMNVLKARAG